MALRLASTASKSTSASANMFTGIITDIGTVRSAEQRGDPLALSRRDDPDAQLVGYPEGVPRQVLTRGMLVGWLGSDEAGWVPASSAACP